MEVCRLCLDLLDDNSFSQLDEPFRAVVSVVAPEVDFDISSNPVFCKQCFSSVDELHKFKAKLIENEQHIKTKCNGEIDDKLSLKELLFGVNLGEIVVTEKAQERICRTCLDSIDCESFTVLKPSKPDAYLDSMIKMCLPELDLEVARDPVMCEKCLGSLQKLHHLKTSCLDVEEKLKNYCTNHGTNSNAKINLHSVLETLAATNKDNIECINIKKEIKTELMDEDSDMNKKSIKVEKDTDALNDEEVEIKTEEIFFTNMVEVSKCDEESKDIKKKEQNTLKVYACAFCNSEFQDRSTLKKHKKSHNGQVKTYDCNKCPSRFTVDSEYYYHIKFGHGKEKRPHICEICSTGYTTNLSLQRHIQRYHAEKKEYPHVCSYCSKGFFAPFNLKQHIIRIHTEERPFKCEYCDKAFAFKTKLTEHTRNHTGERPYACVQCKKTFISASNLIQHKKVHIAEKAALVKNSLPTSS